MKSTIGSLSLLLTFSLSLPCLAADPWFELKGLGPLTQRVAVTIENPADVNDESALVHISLADLSKSLPDAKAGQIAVVDPAVKPAPREQADRNFVPFQVNGNALIFALPLKAHQKKDLYIYTSPAVLNLPGFAAKTAYDSRHAYRSFENMFMAFRLETGPGANTTGMAIDLFGKTKAGHGLRLVQLYEQGDYHIPHEWGLDVLKVGSGPGVAGAYVFSGEEMVRPTSDTTIVDCIYQGPVETVVRVTAPIEIAGELTLSRTLTLVADDRSIHDLLELKGDNLDGLQLGIGLRDLPNQTWVENTTSGYAMVTGDNNQPGCKGLGLSAMFDPSEYVKTSEIPDKKNGGHIYRLEGRLENGVLASRHRLAAIWDGDGQINNPGDLEKALVRWAALRDAPTKVTMGAEAEKR